MAPNPVAMQIHYASMWMILMYADLAVLAQQIVPNALPKILVKMMVPELMVTAAGMLLVDIVLGSYATQIVRSAVPIFLLLQILRVRHHLHLLTDVFPFTMGLFLRAVHLPQQNPQKVPPIIQPPKSQRMSPRNHRM
jgi:hypothetical protein